MKQGSTHQRLLRLHELILQEREFAKNLDVKGMLETVREKEDLIQALGSATSIDEESRPIAKKIRNDNRRNAFLFKSTLGWIRETMQFLGQKTVVATYSAAATTIPSTVNGRLLSGRI